MQTQQTLLTAILLSTWIAPAHSSELQLKDSEFRRVNAQGSFATTQIPLCKGDSYGWFIQLENPPRQLNWREEFRPSGEHYEQVTNQGVAVRWADESWNGPSITTVQTVAPDGGSISYIRPINSNMPPGFYRVDVYIGDDLAAHFRIELLSC